MRLVSMRIAEAHTAQTQAQLSATPERSGTRQALGPQGDVVSWTTLIGPSFEELLRAETTPPLGVRLRVMFDVVLAVAQLHESAEAAPEGSCQGHLTPSDIVVGLNGIAQVQSVTKDFRKGKLPNQPRRGYLAPELLLRKYPASRATDVFSLGVCLWETLTRRRLFPEHKAQLLFDRIRSHELPVIAELPSEAWALLMVAEKAFSYHPKNRYESARAMLADMYHAAGNLISSHVEVAEYARQETGFVVEFREAAERFSDGPVTAISSRCTADIHPLPLSLPKPPALPSLHEMAALSGLIFGEHQRCAWPTEAEEAAAEHARERLREQIDAEVITWIPSDPAACGHSEVTATEERASELPTLIPSPPAPEALGVEPALMSSPLATETEELPAETEDLPRAHAAEPQVVEDAATEPGSFAPGQRNSPVYVMKAIAWVEQPPNQPSASGMRSPRAAVHAGHATTAVRQVQAATLSILCTLVLLVTALLLAFR